LGWDNRFAFANVTIDGEIIKTPKYIVAIPRPNGKLDDSVQG